MGDEKAPPSDLPGLWASLHAEDAYRLVDFLTDGLGFIVGALHGNGSVIHHAELHWPLGGGVMIGSAKPLHEVGTFALRPGTFGCYLVTADTDALFARSLEAGAKVVAEPSDTDFGSRQAIVQDFEWNLWSFGTYRGEESVSGTDSGE